MAKLTMSIQGVNQLLRQLKDMELDVIKQAAKITREELDKLLLTAKRLAPVGKEKGSPRLVPSGRIVSISRISKSGFGFEVVFGGKIVKGRFVDYAEIVHETHKTKSKFLQKAADRHLPMIPKRIERELDLPR